VGDGIVGSTEKRVGTLSEVRIKSLFERTAMSSMNVLLGNVKMLRIGGVSLPALNGAKMSGKTRLKLFILMV